jgi:TRAP transporter TAXI family solute receptor
LIKFNKVAGVLIVVAILLLSALTLGCTQSASKQYKMATGGASGTYYPIGVGIMQTVNNASIGMNLTVETSGASVANARQVNSKQDDFAFIQNDVAYSAYNGVRDFATEGAKKNITGLAVLYPETIQVIVMKSSGINSIADLKGKKVVVGDRGSGSEYNALEILAAYGLSKDDITEDYSKLAQAADLLRNGQADAAFWTGGAPTSAIIDLASTHEINLVPISGTQRDALMANSSFYQRETLPAGTYKGINGTVETVSVMSMLIANSDVPETDVYNLLKAMYDPNAPLKNSHAKAGLIKKETALKGMSIPLHPGAKKYFDEQGIKA